MTIFAPGMEEALRRHSAFPDEASAAAFWAEGAPDVPVEDLGFPGADGRRRPARLYRGTSAGPVLLYVHGGGWVGGSIALNEPACRALCAASGWSVLSVSYRLAPDHPYPAGLMDVRAAARWLRTAGPARGLDPGLTAIGGASAGANLAAAAALAEPGRFCGQVLFYGVFGADLDTASYHAHAQGPGLTRARMAELFAAYDPAERRATDPLIAPLLADTLGGLPAAFLALAELDVLADDSRRFAARLAGAGVRAELVEVAGVTHGFINRGRLVPAARETLSRAATFLRSLESAP